jgi:hypothetical protein
MAQGGRGGAVALALLGLCWGQAIDAVACAVHLQPRAKVGEGQRRLLAHPLMSAAMMALAGGEGPALTLLGSHRGWAADAVARAAHLQPRAKVGEGQRRLQAHPWMSAAVTAPAGGGSGDCFALLASGLGRRCIGLPCALAAPGGGEGGTAALAGGGPGVPAL